MDLEELMNRNKLLEEENKELKEKLKKYTAPARNRAFYEKHKQELLAKNKEYIVSPEKKKHYARTAYLNKKEKIKKEKEQADNSVEVNI